MPSTTGQALIDGALKNIGVITQGETASASELADALVVLNAMLQNWGLEQLNTYQQVVDIGASGAATYTVSPRPTRVVAAQHIIAAGISQPAAVASAEEFSTGKLQNLVGGAVQAVYYDGASPTGTLYVMPSASTGTIRLWILAQLNTFASLATSADLPQGYAHAVMTNLAVELAPMFGRAITPALAQNAASSKAAIRSANAAIPNGQPGGPVSAAQ